MITNRSTPLFLALFATVSSMPVWSHDPIFGLGPHVLFKGGFEVAPEIHLDKTGDEKETELGVELVYGITGDWAAGIELPYKNSSDTTGSISGQGDISLFSKYRFWRKDSPGLQESMTLALKLKTDTGDNNIGTGTTDSIIGLSYGYEGRKWYRWAALRYRINDKNTAGLQRGDKILFDLVGGIRPELTSYREPDTVWILELNGEFGQRAELNGVNVANTGGSEWFVSPGIFWTKRNFAVKAGIQIPIASNLNGTQEKTDYRTKVVLEWHL